MSVKASQVLETVKLLGQEQPDTETGCTYFNDDGTPCCIVGHALHRLGVDPAQFVGNNELNEFTNVLELARYGDDDIVENDLTGEQLERLLNAQERQDGGATWGDAIKALGEEWAA